MRERLITLVFALGALAVFYALFAPKPAPRDTILQRPTSAESREDGYLAARRWLASTGVRVVSLRERYSSLRKPAGDDSPRFAPTGNLLVMTLPLASDPRERERKDLREWVEAGNTLLVMAALGDTPAWSVSTGESCVFELSLLAGVHVNVAGEQTDPPEDEETEEHSPRVRTSNGLQRLPQPQRMVLTPNGRHPLFANVRQLAAETPYPASDWYADLPYEGFIFSLAREEGSPGEAFWLRRLGAGRVLVSGYASLFTNRLLGEQDNAVLLSNIVAQSLGRDGAVIFDDMHQGVSRLYDPEAFFADSRLHGTLWVLFVLWLIWVLGGTRLRALQAPAAVPGEAALVRATGGFLARVLRPAQAARRMLELFFNDLRRRLGEPQNGEPLWQWLERRPQLAASDVEALRTTHTRAAAGRRVDLGKLQALILRIQEQVT